MSCRVIGRKLEETMLSVAIEVAREKKIQYVQANYTLSNKNKPCLDFFLNSGFKNEQNSFIWDTNEVYFRPDYIKINEVR